MPNLREQVEAVLRANQVVCQTTFATPGTTGQMVRDKLVDDLLALLPQPSREVLDDMLCLLHGTVHDATHGDFRRCRPCQEADKRLMAWATGQEERRWCEHIEEKPYLHGATSWRFHGIASYHDNENADLWKFCPLCAAPRPDGPKYPRPEPG